MAEIPGSVRVTGFIAPTDSLDMYASHDSIYGKGGFREVETLIDRDNISTDRRREGMLCFVKEDKKIYQLVNGIENTDWLEFIVDSSNVETHTHSNKIILDETQESFTTVLKANYDEAVTKAHTHSNSTVLNKLSESGETGLPLWDGMSWPVTYVSYVVGENLNKGDVVVLTENNVLMKANQSNLNHIYRVVGLVMDPVITGQSVRVLRYGVLEYVSWDFSANLQAIQYLGTTGNLLTVCPTEGFMLIVGMPVGNNKLFVNLSMPIVL